MMFHKLHVLRVTLASLLLFSLSSCASMGGSMTSAVADALGQVTGFSTSIADWQSSLGGMLDGAGLNQLKEYAGQAGNIGETINGLTDSVSEAMADPMSALGGKLMDMSGLDVDALKNLGAAEQMDAVKGFADSAKGVGSMASDLMSQLNG